MIRVSVFYPNKEGAKFDHDYYAKKHIAMVTKKFGPLLVRAEADKCLSGMAPGSQPPYVAVGYLIFNSIGDMQKAFAQMGDIAADMPNFTNVQPQIQISECTV